MDNNISHKQWAEKLGLVLFSDDVGQSFPIWLPDGLVLKNNIIDILRKENDHAGYLEISTPHISNQALYEKSGHLDLYKDKMFVLPEHVIKPMNCPMHIVVMQKMLDNNVDLPIRISEFAQVYRNESSGSVNGLLRARGFMQDDGHVLIREESLVSEIKSMVNMIKNVMLTLDFDEYKFRIGVRDDFGKYLGDNLFWDAAEKALFVASEELGIKYDKVKGDAAFYGPKLDILVTDKLGREWQMGTIQVDFQLPQLFNLDPYILIHRAIVGSIERCVGVMLEVNDGWLPISVAPVKAEILPISDIKHMEHSKKIAESLGAHVNERNEPISKKIARSLDNKIPIQVIIGDAEILEDLYSIRYYGEDIGKQDIFWLIDKIKT